MTRLEARLDSEVEVNDGFDAVVATGPHNGSRRWLGLSFLSGIPAGQRIELRYRGNLLDPLERPLIGFQSHTGQTSVAALPAPLFGRGQWIGRVPPSTVRVFLSPSRGSRGNAFSIESCRVLSLIDLITLAMRTDPCTAAIAALSLLHSRQEIAGEALAEIAAHHVPAHYHRRRAELERGLGQTDVPLHHAPNGVHIRYICDVDSGTQAALAATVQSVASQVHRSCSIAFVSDHPRHALSLMSRERIEWVGPGVDASTLNNGIDQPVIFAPIVPGGLVPPYAAAAVAEHIATFPQHDLLYGDEDEIDARGRYCHPRLKPDWSPVFEETTGYIGEPLFVSAGVLRRSMLTARELAAPALVRRLFRGSEARAIGHVRRVLLTSPPNNLWGATPKTSPVPTIAKPKHENSPTEVTVVIPTKDKVPLLLACIAGLRKAKGISFEVVLMDNGSQEEATWKFYRTLESDARFRVVRAPGPFNFAQLCNDGARLGRAQCLLFLNNDVEPLDDGWLAELLAWTRRAASGAVGAKLLYPSGRLQHGGMVLGLNGNAGHIDAGISGCSSGYLGRLSAPHEVAAVTGACLAVGRAKFDAVGGFDADHFPVELNDVDLCLRLRAKGWPSLMVPGCRLIHHESATRGRTRKAHERYPREHEAFWRRWGWAIFDDPYFHPALSLTSTQIALG